MAAVALTAGGLVSPALAGTSSTVDVSGTVVQNCSISTGALVFGPYDSTQRDATGTITASCNSTMTFTVALNEGVGTGATTTLRRMTASGGSTLDYRLYRDAGRTQIWGNTPGTDTLSDTSNGTPKSLTIYGRIVAGQFPVAGDYTDSVTATISF